MHNHAAPFRGCIHAHTHVHVYAHACTLIQLLLYHLYILHRTQRTNEITNAPLKHAQAETHSLFPINRADMVYSLA